MKINIIENGCTKHAELMKKHISKRIPLEIETEGMQIELMIDEQLGKQESYKILVKDNGFAIMGADTMGLFFGIGKFLHTAKWTDTEFVPKPPIGVITPASDFRAVYFAIHFYNWYQNAPLEELETYLEELVLWGYNVAVCIIPIVNLDSFEDQLFYQSVKKTREVYQLAKKIGMKVGIILNPNQGLKTTPAEFNADLSFDPAGVRGTAGKNICVEQPGAFSYMQNIWRKQLEQYTDIGMDYVFSWPYDEGGCGCEKCRPWGGNGYLKYTNAIHDEVVKFYPNAKVIVSTWLFDTPEDEGEYESLYKRLEGDMQYVDYLMIDAHDRFPRYPLEHEVIKPIVNFPEISMWKLIPWGGRGANPQLKRFQGFWDETKHLIQGGMPYSEGVYDDILKVLFAGYYWEPDKNYREIMAEYINYEYASDVYDEVLEVMELIEDNHVGVAELREPDMVKAERAVKLAENVDLCLGERAKKSWRWRILYIRAQIDLMTNQYYVDHYYGTEKGLYDVRHTPEEYLADNEKAQEFLQELCRIYHCVSANGENFPTLPPVKGGIVRG